MGSKREDKETDLDFELKQFIKKYLAKKVNLVGVGVFSDDTNLDDAIDKACDDMTARTLKVRKEEGKGGKYFKCDVKKYLKKRMEDYFKFDNYMSDKDKFDGWHKKTCNDILPIIKRHYEARYGEPEEIKYGKAQKIVNMTFKYLYCFAKEEEREKYFIYCHIPLDNYILAAILTKKGLKKDEQLNEWKNCIKKENNDEYKICYKKVNDNQYSLIEESEEGHQETAWSNIESYDLYFKIQDMLRKNIPENLSPLEWEIKVWFDERKIIA